MPVAHFHLVDGAYDEQSIQALLVEASRSYAEILDSPVDRTRAFVVRYMASDTAVMGQLVTDRATPAPYFSAIVLAGRPASQRQALARRFTDLIEELLGVDRSVIRGQVVEVLPENWSIAGEPASAVRSVEIDSRSTS